jgi:hypothetical protein
MKKKNIDCIRLSALTPVLVLSVVMLTTIDGSQNFVQAQNITSAVLPLQLHPQDGTSSPTMSTTPASSEDDSVSGSGSTTNSDDNTSTQDNTPISPASGTSDSDDESSGSNGSNNNDNDSNSSGSNDDDDNNSKDGDSQDTSSNGDDGTSDEDEEETENALTKYGKSQAITQVNECGHGHTAMYVGCQNIDSQIQGDNNRVAGAAAQSFDD